MNTKLVALTVVALLVGSIIRNETNITKIKTEASSRIEIIEKQIEDDHTIFLYEAIENIQSLGYVVDYSIWKPYEKRYSVKLQQDIDRESSTIKELYLWIVAPNVDKYMSISNIYRFVQEKDGIQFCSMAETLGLTKSQARGIFYQLVLLRIKSLEFGGNGIDSDLLPTVWQKR
ncbi:hypothetical protein ACFL1Y_01890 [Patescibacteria group bacterium]